jgi:uncharacterized protein YjbI with pentapeptide repeats
MREISTEQLEGILSEHQLWLNSNGGKGERADLREADLTWVDLEGADLREADLRGTNLLGAHLEGGSFFSCSACFIFCCSCVTSSSANPNIARCS